MPTTIGMPTHREEPWEQDARKARERIAQTRRWPDPAQARRAPERRPTPRRGGGRSLTGLATGVAAVLALLLARAPSPATETSPVPAATPAGRVLSLQSRALADGGFEAWGRTDAPDGATVSVRPRGAPGAFPAVARAGVFYLRTPAAPTPQARRVTATVD